MPAAVVAHNAAMIVEAAPGVDPVGPVDVDPVVVPDADPVVLDADLVVLDADLVVPAVPDADLVVPEVLDADLVVPDVARVAQVAQVEATNLAKRIQNDGPDSKTS